MTKTTYLRVAMVLALVLPAAASAQRRSRYFDDRDDRDTESRIDTTVAFSRSGTVSLNLPSGEVIVRGWDKDQVKVHATSDDGDIRFNSSSSRISLEMTFGRSREGHFEVTMPYGAHLSVRTMSADGDIRDTRGDVEVSSQSGDLRLENIGRLDLSTLSGDVEVQGVGGDAAVHTISGDFHVQDVKGDVDVETVSGGIEVRGANSKFVRLHSVSGDLTYEGTIDPTGRYELTTHSGEIGISMPSNASAQIGVSTWSGSIDSDFPITLKPGEHGFGSASTKKFTFEIGGGAARVSLESFSGDITIKNRKR